jgi:membrane protease YdiL (CAAX protease family)
VHLSLGWYAFAILLPWGTQLLAMLGYRLSGYVRPVLDPWYQLPLLTIVLALFSLGEEIGWRGLLLPTLLEVTSPLAATAWIAFVWGTWHLPFYFARNASGAQTGVDYLLFMAGIFPVSAFFTLLYLRTRSVFLCAVLHGALNSGAAYWFGSRYKTTFAFCIWVAVLWVAVIPILLRVRTSPDRPVVTRRDH